MHQPLDQVLEALTHGDPAAAERVFLAYEPYLRKVVRRQMPQGLRSKFDSVDVVHSVWADLLSGFRKGDWKFADADHLRAFLIRVTRNRLIDRCRRHQSAKKLEHPLADEWTEPVSPESRPSQNVQAQDLWRKLLESCPAEHRTVLRLKREGRSLAEIAADTGLHADSVRRILRNLARRLAFATETASSSPSGADRS